MTLLPKHNTILLPLAVESFALHGRTSASVFASKTQPRVEATTTIVCNLAAATTVSTTTNIAATTTSHTTCRNDFVHATTNLLPLFKRPRVEQWSQVLQVRNTKPPRN